jgi:hypothetical protein
MEVSVTTYRTRDGRKVLPRVHIFPRGETVLEHLLERHSRPYRLYRQEVLPLVWEQLGIDPATVRVRWDQYAGCTCPCSPGFVVTRGYAGRDLSVSVGD